MNLKKYRLKLLVMHVIKHKSFILPGSPRRMILLTQTLRGASACTGLKDAGTWMSRPNPASDLVVVTVFRNYANVPSLIECSLKWGKSHVPKSAQAITLR